MSWRTGVRGSQVEIQSEAVSRPFAKRWAGLALVLLLAACAPLQPVDLPPESAPVPAANAFWSTLETTRQDEWYALLNDGPAALDWRLQAIDAATHSIELQTFLWHIDAVGSAIIHHLLQAADRGVRIRILVDDSFLLGEDGQLLYLQQHPNIDYRIYNPYQRRSSNVATGQALNLAEFHRLDHRMHNKAMIVDGRVAIVGGRNLGDEYFGLHGEANFRDLELLLGGPAGGLAGSAGSGGGRQCRTAGRPAAGEEPCRGPRPVYAQLNRAQGAGPACQGPGHRP